MNKQINKNIKNILFKSGDLKLNNPYLLFMIILQ